MTSQGPVSFGLPEEGSPPRSFDDNDADQDKQRIAVLSSIATFLEKRPRTKGNYAPIFETICICLCPAH